MSCPARESLIAPDDAESLPMAYTLYMIAIVSTCALAYRYLWLAWWDSSHGPPGLQMLGKRGDRNLSKEFTEEYSKRKDDTVGKSTWRVEALFDYPIKSTYPVEVQESVVGPTGFKYDRQFCFAQWKEPMPTAGVELNLDPEPEKGSDAYWKRTPHWAFVTQRECPRLTLVKAEIWVPVPYGHRDYDEDDEYTKSEGCLIVKFPFSPDDTWARRLRRLFTLKWSAEETCSFQILFNPTAEQIGRSQYSRQRLRVWRDEPAGLNMTTDIPQDTLDKLRYILGISNDLALFRVDVNRNRNLYKCAPTEQQLGYQAHVGFQDSYPLHIQNMSSILNLESKISQENGFTPDPRRYRANIYISGPKAFDEDDWTLIQIGAHKFHVSCRTTRCILPTTNPETGYQSATKQPEPTRSINKTRKIDEGNKNSGCLGMQMVPTKDAIGAVIRVGDEVKVLKRGEHWYVKDPKPEAQRPVL